MLLDPVTNEDTLPVIDVETNAEARADGAANHGRDVDDSLVRKAEGNVNRLTDGQGHGRIELHAADGKIAAFGRHAVDTIVAPDYDRNLKWDAWGPPSFAAELKLSFC